MSSFGRFSSASPVMALPPQPAHQTSFGMDSYASQSTPFGHATAAFQRCAASSLATSSNLRVAGRKRSRDEAAPNLVADEPEPKESKEPEEEWEYGPGMVLIKKGGYVADASSQSGTWVEEKAAEDDARKAKDAVTRLHEQQQRPSLRSNKSQRLTQNNIPAYGAISHPAVVARSEPVSLESPAQPVVDQFTLHLGIGWRRISEDQHIQAAARGWARYIENHYPVSSATIRLESKGLQSYLVEATEGFFLFSEDLRQGRLVSRDVEGALRNLKCSPPVFDSPETMAATESPAANEPSSNIFAAPADSHMEMC